MSAEEPKRAESLQAAAKDKRCSWPGVALNVLFGEILYLKGDAVQSGMNSLG